MNMKQTITTTGSVLLTLGVVAMPAQAKDRYSESDYGRYLDRDYQRDSRDHDGFGKRFFGRNGGSHKYARNTPAKFRKFFDNPTLRRNHSRQHRHVLKNRRSITKMACKSPRRIYRKMIRRGWWDFNNLKVRRRSFIVTARQSNGYKYRLRMDRCTGIMLKARMVNDSFWLSRMDRFGFPVF